MIFGYDDQTDSIIISGLKKISQIKLQNVEKNITGECLSSGVPLRGAK